MGIDLTANKMIDAALKKLSSGSAGGADTPGGVALPDRAPDPKAVDAFKTAMEKTEVSGIEKTDPAEKTAMHFPGDLDAPAAGGPPAPESGQITQEAYIKSMMDIFKKTDLSHADLFKLQVLSSAAKIEVTRNSSITKSLDDGMKTMIKSSS